MSSNTDRPVSVALDLRLAGYRGGGIARYGTQLFAALQQESGIALTALRSRSDGNSTGDQSVRMWTPPHYPLEHIALPIEIVLRRAVPDVYHAIDFIAPRLPKAAVVATVHDLAFRPRPEDLAPDALAYYQQIERTRRWTDAWITPSQWTAAELSEMYSVDRDRIHVVPHGESLGLSSEMPLPVENRGDFILAVGTIEPRKSYDLLLDAWALTSELADVELVIVGQPGWRSDDTQSRIVRTPGVRWLRDVDDTKLRRLYREALAVVVPSRSEGFGLTALEAMAAGTPVLSSGGGALPEVTGTAALEVADAVPEAWAAAIDSIVSSSAQREILFREGRLRSEEFSWERSGAATASIYLALAGK